MKSSLLISIADLLSLLVLYIYIYMNMIVLIWVLIFGCYLLKNLARISANGVEIIMNGKRYENERYYSYIAQMQHPLVSKLSVLTSVTSNFQWNGCIANFPM